VGNGGVKDVVRYAGGVGDIGGRGCGGGGVGSGGRGGGAWGGLLLLWCCCCQRGDVLPLVLRHSGALLSQVPKVVGMSLVRGIWGEITLVRAWNRGGSVWWGQGGESNSSFFFG